jgi:hypothetical protein
VTDDELVTEWATLRPTADQRRRIDARVVAWLEAGDTSLAAEWVTLFKGAPLSSLALVAASAVAVFMAPPMVWLARVLL